MLTPGDLILGRSRLRCSCGFNPAACSEPLQYWTARKRREKYEISMNHVAIQKKKAKMMQREIVSAEEHKADAVLSLAIPRARRGILLLRVGPIRLLMEAAFLVRSS
jgi:hypothetical protein